MAGTARRLFVPLVGALLLQISFAGARAQVSPESAEKYNAGQDLYQKRRYQDAVAAFDASVQLDETNAQAYRALGKTYQKLRDFDKALASYQKAVSVNPVYSAAYYEMGALQLRLDKYRDAQASMKKLLAIDPDFEEGKAREILKVAYLKQGIRYHRQKNYRQAAAQYESATQVDPTDASAFYNLGLAQKGARNFSAAREAFQTAVDLDPEYAKAYRALGDLNRATKRTRAAIAAYQKAIDSDPSCKDRNNITAYLSLAVAYNATKQHAKAASVLEKAAGVAPTRRSKVKVYTAWGHARALRGQHSRAIQSYNQALDLDRRNAEAHYRMAAAHLELKQYGKAISAAKQALGSSRFRVPANVIIADAYEGRKQDGWKELAIVHYKKGLKDRRYQKYCEDKIDRILNPMGQSEADAQ